MSFQLESSQAAILGRVIQPGLADWPPAAAEVILPSVSTKRIESEGPLCLEKAKQGDLSNEEAEALENYRHIGKLLELMRNQGLGVH